MRQSRARMSLPKRPMLGSADFAHLYIAVFAALILLFLPHALFAAVSSRLMVATGFNAKGYNLSIDSFQSTNVGLFPGGVWNASNRLDHGYVATLSTNPSDLN